MKLSKTMSLGFGSILALLVLILVIAAASSVFIGSSYSALLAESRSAYLAMRISSSLNQSVTDAHALVDKEDPAAGERFSQADHRFPE